LGHFRAAMITAINIPLALLIAFCGLVGTQTSANLISLGAVDFGIVVDSSVIMMENIFRHLGSHGKGPMSERISQSSREVATPMAFSTLIIGVAFLPLFTMTGVAGVIFAPMARTYAFAIGGAIFLALTLTPVLASKLLPASAEDKESAIMRILHKAYAPFFDAALRYPKRSLLVGFVPIVLGIALFPLIGREFMPHLEEGNFWIRATLPMSISLDQSAKYVGRMRRILRGCPQDENAPCDDAHRTYPEVESVVSQLGRPDDGTDVTGFSNIEFFAPLKPFDEWRRGLTKEKLTEQINAELSQAFPGVVFNFSQYISDNVEEAISGVKGENSVKVFSQDFDANENIAEAIVDTMSQVRGVADLGHFQVLGEPSIKITPRREACARYGLNTGDVDTVIQAAIGGQAVTQVYEGEKFFSLTVRWKPEYRKSLEAMREITVATADGNFIPLGQIADIETAVGPAMIYREDGVRYSPVKFSVRGRDLAGTIAEAERSRGAAQGHHPHHVAAHRFSHLQRCSQLGRYSDCAHRYPGRHHRWRPRAPRHRNSLLGVGRDGVHLDLRHRHPGRDPHRHLLPAPPRHRGPFDRAGRARGRREALPARLDDHARRDSRSHARRAVERNRRTDAETARCRRHRRIAHSRHLDANSAAAAPRSCASMDGEAKSPRRRRGGPTLSVAACGGLRRRLMRRVLAVSGGR
jgi:cobalt-zinc-cadmium resistance protein CzcA